MTIRTIGCLLQRMSPVLADFVAKVPNYLATIISKETKLNQARFGSSP